LGKLHPDNCQEREKPIKEVTFENIKLKKDLTSQKRKIDIIGNNFLAHAKTPRRKAQSQRTLCDLAAWREISYFQ